MHFEKPTIHNVTKISATTQRVSREKGGGFSSVRLEFEGVNNYEGDGTEDHMTIFFDDAVPEEYVTALVAAINKAALAEVAFLESLREPTDKDEA